MKTRTMKKALSLFLAVLMIALAIPFTLLPVSAEGETPEIVNATIKGYFPENDKNRAVAFENARGPKIYDGDVTTDVYSEAYNSKANSIKNSYFDAYGKYGYEKNEAVDGGYYHVIFLELNEKSTIDTLNLWADSGRQSEWFGPNGYDIWYSADGETYTNSGLSFSDIRNDTQVDPDIYVDDTFNGSACIAHHIDMGDVEAKYIAIAVTAFAYGSGSGQSVLYEVTVDGSVIYEPVIPENSVSIVGVTISGWLNDGSLNRSAVFENYSNGNRAIDGDITTDLYTHAYNSSTKRDWKKTSYFDSNGKYGYSETENYDDGYYFVYFVELSEMSKVDKFNLWADSGRQSEWFGPNGYDIWYSADGETYTNSGLSFSDIRNDTQVDPDIYVDDTFNGSACIAHHIDMDGVIAKYIAIAVTAPAYGSSKGQGVLYELTVNGAPATMYLESGASVRMDDPTGLRFTGLVSKSYVEGLKEEYQTEDVTLGMLITPTSYLNDVDFTKEALSGTNYDPAYLEIDAAAETVKEDGDYYKIKCVIANIQNYDREFSAILYVKVNGEILAYSEYNEVFNSRSVSEVAEAAYYDLKDTKDDTYKNEVKEYVGEEEITKYSRYDTNQREVLYGFFGQGEQ